MTKTNEERGSAIVRHAERNKDEISLQEVASALWFGRRRIGLVSFGFGAVAVVGTLLMPNIYTAQTVLMPPQQQQSAASAVLAQLGGLAGGAGAALGLKSPNDIYVSIIKSRSVADKMIRQFDLQKRYGTKNRDETIAALAGVVDVTSGKDGLIAIKVDDEDPEFAAKMANAFVEAFREVSGGLAVTNAAQRRLFYQQQLELTKHALMKAETDLASVQAKTGILELGAQGKATMEAVAGLRANIAAKTVELTAMRQAMTVQNPELVRAEAGLQGLRAQLEQMLGKRVDKDQAFLSRDAIPEAGLEYVRALREVKYHELLLEMLAKQFEIARLDEANEGAVVQVLDRATAPDKKSKPKRAFLVIIFTLLGAVAAAIWVLMRSYWPRSATQGVN